MRFTCCLFIFVLFSVDQSLNDVPRRRRGQNVRFGANVDFLDDFLQIIQADASMNTNRSGEEEAPRMSGIYISYRWLAFLALILAASFVYFYFLSNGSTKATVAYDNQVKKATSPEEYEKYEEAIAIAIATGGGFAANRLEMAIADVAGKHKHCQKLWDALEFQDSEDHCKESDNSAVKKLLSAFQDEFGTGFLVRRKMIHACLKIKVLGRVLEKLKTEQ